MFSSLVKGCLNKEKMLIRINSYMASVFILPIFSILKGTGTIDLTPGDGITGNVCRGLIFIDVNCFQTIGLANIRYFPCDLE